VSSGPTIQLKAGPTLMLGQVVHGGFATCLGKITVGADRSILCSPFSCC